MNDDILITVGIPFYNAAKTIFDAVKSVFAQTYKNWELILVDDGSTDEGLEIVKKIKSEKVILVSDGKNMGLAARLNMISEMAKGLYVARMDADDIMFPERLGMQIRFFKAYPDTDLLGASVVCVDGGNQICAVRPVKNEIENAFTVIKGEVLIHPTVMATKEWFIRNPYDASYRNSEDYELWCRTAGAARIANLSQPLLFYREYGVYPFNKYLPRSRISRKIISFYGPEKIGRTASNFLISRRLFLEAAYFGLHVCGMWRLTHIVRNRSLTDNEIINYGNVMDRVMETVVPVG